MNKAAQTVKSKDLSTNSGHRYIGVAEAAKILKVSPSSLRRFEKENKIKSVRQSNGYRNFSIEDIVKLRDRIKQEKATVKNPVNKNINKRLAARLTKRLKLIQKANKTLAIIALGILTTGTVYTNRTFVGGLNPFADDSNNSNEISNVLGLNTKNAQKEEVLAARDKDANFNFNINVPAVFKQGANVEDDLEVGGATTITGATTTSSVNLIGGATINNVLGINATTQTTFENTLTIAGQVVSTDDGLQSVELADSIEYSGDWDFTGTWNIEGTEITATAKDINAIKGLDFDGLDDTSLLAGATATTGGIIFGDGDSFIQDATNLFWNDSTNRLGIGDNTPDHTLDVGGNIGILASGFLNFGDTTGPTGYGIRDNAGTIEVKNSGGAWATLAASSLWTDLGASVYPTGGETLGDSTSGNSNKLAGVYLSDDNPLTFGTNNDLQIIYDETTDDRLEIGDGTNDFLSIIDNGTTAEISVNGNITLEGISDQIQSPGGSAYFRPFGSDLIIHAGDDFINEIFNGSGSFFTVRNNSGTQHFTITGHTGNIHTHDASANDEILLNIEKLTSSGGIDIGTDDTAGIYLDQDLSGSTTTTDYTHYGIYNRITDESTVSSTNQQIFGTYSEVDLNGGVGQGGTYAGLSGRVIARDTAINNAIGVRGGVTKAGIGNHQLKAFEAQVQNNNASGTLTESVNYYASSPSNSSGTITDSYGLYVQDQAVGTTTNAYGVYVDNQAGASTTNVGVYIEDAATYALQLASTDGDAASGITFGTDTNLYRSAANILTTPDTFTAQSGLNLFADTNLILDFNDGANSGLTFDNANNWAEIRADGTEVARFKTGDDIDVNGVVNTNAFDIAELYPTLDKDLQAGDVVMIDSVEQENYTQLVKKADYLNRDKVVGVVSTEPGLTLGGGTFTTEFCEDVNQRGAETIIEEYLAELSEQDNFEELNEEEIATLLEAKSQAANTCKTSDAVLVALAGRVPVKVDLTSGEIAAGDPITIAPEPGHAMKALTSGMILGRALEKVSQDDYDEGKTTVMIMVQNTWWQDTSTGEVLGSTITSLETNSSSIENDLDITELTLDGDLKVLGDTILNNATILSTVNIGLTQVNAANNSIGILGATCFSEDTDAKNTDLCETQTLHLQKDSTGNVSIFDNKIVLEPEGKITAEEYVVRESSETVGSSNIKAENTEVEIVSTKVKEDSKIIITPTTSTNNEVLYVSNITEGENFEIKIDNAVDKDIEFNWWILNVN